MIDQREIDGLLQEFCGMGFDPQDILMAYLNSNQRRSLVLDNLLVLAEKNKKLDLTMTRKISDRLTASQAFDKEIQKAIRASIDQNEGTFNPTELKRNSCSPVGLKNIGNTCYFNSLMQSIFQIKDLVKMVLAFTPPADLEKLFAELDITDTAVVDRKKACVKLIIALQKLFSLMLMGNKNVVDPTEVMNSVVDGQGTKVAVGEQLDVTEFSNNLFDRIEEGLALDAYKVLENPPKQEEKKQEGEEGGELPSGALLGTFFSKAKEFITFEWAEVKSKKNQDAILGPISIDINQKDLMSGLDAFFNFSVDGYRSPNGEITTAKKKIWFTEPPAVLTFILQRVGYDKEKGLKKNTDPFVFQKEIFLDRFLYDNKKPLKNMFDEKKSLKFREKRIDSVVNSIKEYKDSNMSVMDLLSYTDQIVTEQIDELEKDFVEVNSDSADERIDDVADSKELRRFSDILKQYKEKMQLKMRNLEEKKSYLKKKVETSFQSYKQLKYRIHSVVIHEGKSPNGGHYYSFIYDAKNEIWRKYNDSTITEVSEQEVMKVSFGGEGTACAYCLFYVQDDCEVVEFNQQYMSKIKNLMPESTQKYIDSENGKFLTEYQHFNNNTVKTIYDDYLLKMNNVNFEVVKLQNEMKNNSFPFIPPTYSFNSFLFLDAPKSSELGRWNTLKSVMHQKKVPYDVLGGETKNYYYRDLRDLVCSGTSVYSLKSLLLTDKQKELYKQKAKEYMAVFKFSLILQSVFTSISSKKWATVLAQVAAMHDVMSMAGKNEYTNCFYTFSSYLLTLLSLRCCAVIDYYISKSDPKEALKVLEVMIYALTKKKCLQPPNIFYQQIIANLYHIVNNNGRKCMKDQDLYVCLHLISKIEEKREYQPGFEPDSLLPTDLTEQLKKLDSDNSILLDLDFKLKSNLNEKFKQIEKEKLKIWSDLEFSIRQSGKMIEQEHRIQKEFQSTDA